jgi:hypothetical protein
MIATKINRVAQICQCGNHAFCDLTRGKVTLFSPADIAIVEGHLWNALKCGSKYYARSFVAGKVRLLHREIMQPSGKCVVDHINGDTLDNQRHNLRSVPQFKNVWNSKKHRKQKYKGVQRSGKKFAAYISRHGSREYLGTFPTDLEAAKIYDESAIRLFGDYAKVNFPEKIGRGSAS